MSNPYIQPLLLFLSCFILRALPKLMKKGGVLHDTYYHLYFARTIRENKFRIPEKSHQIVLGHRNTYPYLYHYVVALFQEKFHKDIVRFSSAFFDSLSTLVVYYFSSFLCLQYNLDSALPFKCALLFCFSPALLRIGSGPRAFNGSPRVLGQFLYLLHISCFAVYSVEQSIYLYCASIGAGALLILASKFGNQVLFFSAIPIIIFFDIGYAYALGLILIVSVCISNRYSLVVLVNQIRHSKFYFKHLQKVFIHPHLRSFSNYRATLKKNLTLLRKGQYLFSDSFIQWFYTDKYFFHILITTHIPFLISIALAPGELQIPILKIWLYASAGLYFLTLIKPLRFLGEPERYLEYGAFPALFFFTWLSTDTLYTGWLIYSIFAWFFYYSYYLKVFTNNETPEDPVIKALANITEGTVFPLGSQSWKALYYSKCKILTYGCNIDEKILSKEDFFSVYENYPYPPADFMSMDKKYSISHIFTEPASLKHYLTHISQDDGLETNYEVQAQTDSLILLKKRTSPGESFVPRLKLQNQAELLSKYAIEYTKCHIQLLQESQQKIAVFPAGKYTREVLNHFTENESREGITILDDHVDGEQIHNGFTVKNASNADIPSFDTVLLFYGSYSNKLVNRARNLFGDKLLDVYENIPPSPSSIQKITTT